MAKAPGGGRGADCRRRGQGAIGRDGIRLQENGRDWQRCVGHSSGGQRCRWCLASPPPPAPRAAAPGARRGHRADRVQRRPGHLRHRCRRGHGERRGAHEPRRQLSRRRRGRVGPQVRPGPGRGQCRRPDPAGRQADRRGRGPDRHAARRHRAQSPGRARKRRPHRRRQGHAQRQPHDPRQCDLLAMPGDQPQRLSAAAELVDHGRADHPGSSAPAGPVRGRAAAAVRSEPAAASDLQHRHRRSGDHRLAGARHQFLDQEGAGGRGPLPLADRPQPRFDRHPPRLHRRAAGAGGQISPARPAWRVPARRIHHVRQGRERRYGRDGGGCGPRPSRLRRGQRQGPARVPNGA